MMADTAVAGERVSFVPAWTARIVVTLSDRLAAEGERRLLWLPVFFGADIRHGARRRSLLPSSPPALP